MTRISGLRAAVAASVAAGAALTAACGSGTGTSSSAATGSAYAGKTIRIGAVISRSGAGAIYGPSQKNGIDLAVDVINSSGGINGAKIAVEVVDDQSDKSQAAQQFQTLIQRRQVLLIVGPTLSNQAIAAHPVANQLRTPVVAISNTGIGIVGSCPYPCDYIFRDSLGEQDAIPADVASVVKTQHPKTAVVMYANDDKFSSDGRNIFEKALEENGVTLSGTVAFSKNETDFSSFVTTAKGYGADLLVVSTLGGPASKITIEARRQGFKGPIVGGNGFNTSAVSRQAGSSGKGVQVASAYYLGSQGAANRDFVHRYQAAYGGSPDQIAAQAYTAILVIAQAGKDAGLAFADVAEDRTRLRDALAKVRLEDSPLGPFSFTSGHDVKQPINIVTLDGQGGFTLVTTVKPG